MEFTMQCSQSHKRTIVIPKANNNRRRASINGRTLCYFRDSFEMRGRLMVHENTSDYGTMSNQV